ncbi:MAG: DUF2341 domain-containing protein [Spirochaetota bacterium]|nr:DUF2341 domain-containing protein [Spirochaetota bacterium]
MNLNKLRVIAINFSKIYVLALLTLCLSFYSCNGLSDSVLDPSDFVTSGDSIENNHPPTLETIGDRTVKDEELLQFTISAEDPDNDALTFYASNLPTGATFDPHNLQFFWTPNYNQTGNYKKILFTVTDSGIPSKSDSESIAISVGNVNRPPCLEEIEDKHVKENEILQFTISARDPDGDDLTYSVSNLPRGATFNASTGEFFWQPDYTQSGNHKDILFTVIDNGTPSTLSDSKAINITVGMVNSPPILTPIGDKLVNENDTLSFTISATDIDGDELTYSASNLPTGASLNTPQRLFSWTPDYSQSGNYKNILFVVTDNGTPSENDYEEITITVGNVNRPPLWDTIGDKTISEGELLQFTISATDPDGDGLIYSGSNLPTGAYFNSQTRVFSWIPDYTQSGNYRDITFTVVDDGIPTEGDNEAITITVGNINRPPVLDPIGDRNLTEGELLEFTIFSTDPDGDNLTYSASNLPKGADFNSDTRIFSWTPNYSQSGIYTDVKFTVTDNGIPNESDLENITITVNNRQWWDISWGYRREIILSDNGSEWDLTNYQVNINLDSSFDFAKADENGDDIRFTYYESMTQSESEINYWIENWDVVAKEASIWVNVTTIPSDSIAVIYIYYGNDSVSAVSSKELTFYNDNFIDTFYNSTKIDTQESSNISVYNNNVIIDIDQYTTIYNYDGVTQSLSVPKAYENDVDRFPFEGDPARRNDHEEATDSQYAAIAASDNNRWETDNPGYSVIWGCDEMMLWLDMVIDEPLEDITYIDLTFEGYYSDQSGDFRIYVLERGADWWMDESWNQLGSELSIPSGTDGVISRPISSDFDAYIDELDGNITWVVGAPDVCRERLYIDYVEMEVFTHSTLVSVAIPEDENTRLIAGETLSFNDTEPTNTEIRYYIEYNTGDSWTLIPDSCLFGNFAGFDESQVDISSIARDYGRIRLRAELSTTNSSITPILHDWKVFHSYRKYVDPEPSYNVGEEESL